MLKPSILRVIARFSSHQTAVRGPRDCLGLLIPRNRERVMIGKIVPFNRLIVMLLLNVLFFLNVAAATAAEAKGKEQEKEEKDDSSHHSADYGSDVGLTGSSDDRLTGCECSSGASGLGRGCPL